MSVVRVKDSHVLERQITGKTGPMTFREQRACLLMGGYESVFNIALGSGGAYSPGDYLIHPDSYANDKYGKLAFNRISLIPLSVALKDIVGKDAKAS